MGGATGEFSDRSAQNPPSRGAQSAFRVGKKFPHGLLELRELMLPALRDDLHMADSYDYEEGNPLPCPLSVFAGADDAFADPEALLEWKRYALAAFRLQVFPGDHFFIQKYQEAVLEAVRQDLAHSPCDLNHF